MYFNIFYKLNINSDFLFYNIFFNFSNYNFLTYFITYIVEIFLLIYILYFFLFFKETLYNVKLFFYQYLFFLIFNLIFIVTYIYFFNSFSIISFQMINNHYIMYCKFFVFLITIIILFINKNKFFVSPSTIALKEIPCLFSFLLLFICILFSAFDFFVIYLVIEAISLIVYTLGSLMNESLINLEAVIKYFIINNIASSLLLWSISYIYILTGSTDCFELQYLLISSLEKIITENLYYVCFILIVSIFLKLAIFPLQWWVADIYEGFWTPITLSYAVLIKITFFLFFFKLILNIFYPIIFLFQPFLWISALGSVFIGSLGALIQVKIKRFLAYTSIAQSGYIIMGLSCNSLNGSISAFLYLIMYCMITLSFFCVLINIEHIKKGYNMTYLNQLYSVFLYNKEIAFHIIIIIFVMAAIPPFSSFFAKFFIFIVSIETKLELITVLLLFLTLISTFYYLNFIQQLIFFKINDLKIFYFKENILYYTFLRLNSFIFSFAFLKLTNIYDFVLIIITSCLWPLSY